jgi:hypothetical protein
VNAGKEVDDVNENEVPEGNITAQKHHRDDDYDG